MRKIFQQLEGVSLDPFDLVAGELTAIGLFVHFRGLERSTRGIHCAHPRTFSCQVQSEAAVIGKDVEALTKSVFFRARVVLLLVSEPPGLLTPDCVQTDPP